MKRQKSERSKINLTRIEIDEVKITERARAIVQKIVDSGKADHHDIADKCGTTVLALLDGGNPTLHRGHFISLATHYNVALFWLWYGQGPKFIKPSSLN